MLTSGSRVCHHCGYGIHPDKDRCLRCGASFIIYQNKPECFTKMANMTELSICNDCQDFSVCWRISFLHLKKGIDSSLGLVRGGFKYM